MQQRFFVLCLAMLVGGGLLGQTRQAGLLPGLTLSGTLNEKLKLTAKVESMQQFYEDDESTALWQHRYRRTDAQLFLSGKLGPLWSLAGGYQFRHNGTGPHAQRLIQQLAYVNRKTGYRLGHRLRSDQTFRPDETPEWRLRYRLSVEFPLSGMEVDPGEYYTIISGEPIYALQSGSGDLENRLAVSIGKYFDRRHKLETGLDFRAARLLGSTVSLRYWWQVSWFVNF